MNEGAFRPVTEAPSGQGLRHGGSLRVRHTLLDVTRLSKFGREMTTV